MIGNDIVDLQLAKTESNWQRKGFLNKIFTENEQIVIKNSNSPEIMVWNLWSRKEAAYKIWNRTTGIRKFNPIKFECFDNKQIIGIVKFGNTIYYTKTEILNNCIHTVAALNKADFKNIKFLKPTIQIIKKDNLPFYFDEKLNTEFLASKSNHGNFEKIVYLNNS